MPMKQLGSTALVDLCVCVREGGGVRGGSEGGGRDSQVQKNGCRLQVRELQCSCLPWREKKCQTDPNIPRRRSHNRLTTVDVPGCCDLQGEHVSAGRRDNTV